jgi:acyl carrier protein
MSCATGEDRRAVHHTTNRVHDEPSMSTLESERNFHPGSRAAAAPEGVEPMSAQDPCSTAERVKRLIVENLHLDGLTPEMIDENAPLFGEGLGLDSVDALELVVAVEKEFGIKIRTNEIGREVFSSVASLSQFIAGRT